MIRLRPLFALLICFVLFTSCTNTNLYEKSVEFKDSKWARIENGKDVLFEDIKIRSTEDPYDINISFSHTKDINVEDITLILKLISPSGIRKETVHTIELMDRNKEKFIGKQEGDIISITAPLKQYLFLPEEGEYDIIISNYGTKYEIRNIKDITIAVEKSDLDYTIE